MRNKSKVKAISLKSDVIDRVEKEAKEQNRSVSNFIETVLISHFNNCINTRESINIRGAIYYLMEAFTPSISEYEVSFSITTGEWTIKYIDKEDQVFKDYEEFIDFLERESE